MTTNCNARRRAGALAAAIGAAALVFGPMAAAGADPVSSGTASAYGVAAELGGEEAIQPTPTAEAAVSADDSTETLVSIPADPLVVSGTFTASAAAHEASDIESALAVNEQEVAGPYNTQGLTLVKGLEVLLDSVEEDVSLVTAEVVRSEAVGVCTGGAVQYSANSEIVNLVIGGEPVPLNGPVEEIVAGIDTVLTETTLDQVIDVDYNVVTEGPDGIAVDALVITLLDAAGDTPAGEVRIGHAETGGLVCGAATEAPECSDGADNDGDGFIDHPDDPGCDSPEDDSETDVAGPQTENALPRTGSGSTVALAAGAALALTALGLRRFRTSPLS